MYRNDPEIDRHLLTGGTLVVPTRQRAAAVALAFTAERLGEGARVWNSPDVLTWPVWLRERATRRDGRRRFAAVEEWLLWSDVVAEAVDGRGILFPDALAEDVQAAATLLDEWQLDLRAPATDESALLLRARAEVQRRRAALEGEDSGQWRRETATLVTPTFFAGFDHWAPENIRQLKARGARFSERRDGESSLRAAQVRTVRAADDHDELQRMAAWCRHRLLADPHARLLVLVPDLTSIAAPLKRALSSALTVTPDLDAARSLFALEGGVQLRSYPLVQAALDLLRLATQRVEFEQLSALLRTVWLDFGDTQARLDLDLWLREQNLIACDHATLRRIVAVVGASVGAPAAAALLRLIEPMLALPAGRLPCSQWAQHFAALLASCGWAAPAGLHSAELQVRVRFDQLLGEFAAGDETGGLLHAAQALGVLERWVGRAMFEPASDDVAVTVSSVLDDPIVRYDGIWVMGLIAEVWPRAPQPDALVPLQLQIEAGMPAADHAGRLAQARTALRAWEQCSDELMLSWPQQREGIDMQPSPLLPAAVNSAAPLPPDTSMELWQGVVLQEFPLRDATPWPGGRRLPGGTRALDLQSACPFRASAELRLDCAPLPEPAPGLDARMRGKILHRALHQLWLTLGGSTGLQESPAVLAELSARCAARAVQQEQGTVLVALHPRVLDIERHRTAELLLQLLDSERERAPFKVLYAEHELQAELAGFPLRLRLDRVDIFDDGAAAVIDFKSGAWQGFDAQAERPTHPQLLAYAAALSLPVAALAAVYAGVKGVRWAGLADTGSRLQPLHGADEFNGDWPALREQWRVQIERLAAAFGAGAAAVDPAPHACQYCHLRLLCRVDTEQLEEAAHD